LKKVAVAWSHTRDIKGINDLSEFANNDIQLLNISKNIKECFKSQYNTDAHFVTYQVRSESYKLEKSWPRLNKESHFSIDDSGHKVLTRIMAFDFDLPDHSSWTQQKYDIFLDQIRNSKDTVIRNPTVFYLTEHGARWVYILKKPIPVIRHESYYNAIVKHFMITSGLKFDPVCNQWNRLFRLPFVLRGETPTWDRTFIRQTGIVYNDFELDLSEITPLEGNSVKDSNLPALDSNLSNDSPDDIEKFRPMYYTSIKKAFPSWMTAAYTKIKGRKIHDIIFADPIEPIANPGNRDVAIMEAVGSAVSLLCEVDDITVEKIYGLLYDCVAILDPDRDVQDWTEVLWDKLCRLWTLEQRKLAKQQTKKQTFWGRIRAGVSEWNPHLSKLSDAEQNTWIREHSLSVVATGKQNIHVMRPSGYFDHIPVNSATLHARIRELGMQEVLPLSGYKEGKRHTITSQTLLNRSATIIHRSEIMGCEAGTYIQGIDTDNPILRINSFNRKTNIQPTRDKKVEEWLYHLANKEDQTYYNLCRWIAWALAVEEGPICGLALIGASGSGKKMFVRGLAECFNTECVAEQKEFANFQSQLFHTPIMLFDEGIPLPKQGQMRFIDQFRHYVSGDGIEGERKYLDIMQIRTPIRCIFTANNITVIKDMIGNQDLSSEDRDALVIRLLHIQASHQAKNLLERKGGRAYTSGWIASDAGVGSLYKIAMHFMWLYTQRNKYERGNRLLVEGPLDQEVFDDLLLVSGIGPQVADLIIQMIECPSAVEGLHIDKKKRLFVLTKGILDFSQGSSRKRSVSRDLTLKRIPTVLKALCMKDLAEKATMKSTVLGNRRGRWHEIDPASLLQISLKYGMPCSKLSQLVAEREGISLEELAENVIRTESHGISEAKI
jgi:hypothetical protein|tara:strand:+ start:613 stop:3282 length:2670 start_codon:yes stop_codon:yes gene_type:complete